MSRELRERVEALEMAIRKHRDQRGDDRCWLDDEELYRVLPEGYTAPSRDSAVELELCKKYIASRHNPGTEYISPQRKIEELEALLECEVQRARYAEGQLLLTRHKIKDHDDLLGLIAAKSSPPPLSQDELAALRREVDIHKQNAPARSAHTSGMNATQPTNDLLAALRHLSLSEVDQRIADLDAERAALSLLRRSLVARDKTNRRNRHLSPRTEGQHDT